MTNRSRLLLSVVAALAVGAFAGYGLKSHFLSRGPVSAEEIEELYAMNVLLGQVGDCTRVEIIPLDAPIYLRKGIESLGINWNTEHPPVDLHGTSARKIALLFSQIEVLPQGYGMLCHVPPYQLRFYNDEELVLDTTVCWMCNNAALPSSDSSTSYITFAGSGRWAMRLLDEIQMHVPLPHWAVQWSESIMDREEKWIQDLKIGTDI